MKEDELIEELEALRQHHRYVEDDTYYSCPKAPEGCADPSQGKEYNCGADRHNAILDRMIKEIKEDSACPLCGSAIL